MTIAYHTAERPRADRFRFWSGLMCRTFAPAEGRIEDVADFDAQCSVSEFGSATVCRLRAPRQFWARSRRHVQRTPRDEYLFTQILAGSGVLRQDGQELRLGPGTMSVYDLDRPYTYEVGGDVIFVKLPRRQIVERIGTPRALGAALGSGDRALADWASRVVLGAADLPVSEASPAFVQVGDAILSVVAALLNSAPEGSTPDSDTSESILLDRVCAYIGSRLGDPALTLGAIARKQGLSERSLNRLFATRGITPMKWVLQQRLASSLRALQAGGRSVTDIAFAHGFNDLSHFSRVFKKAYSVPPQRVPQAGTLTERPTLIPVANACD